MTLTPLENESSENMLNAKSPARCKKRLLRQGRERKEWAKMGLIFSLFLLNAACNDSPPKSTDAGSALTAGNMVINEIMTDNNTGLPDEQGNFSDWIELKNTGETEISLAGFSLSDDELDLRKFVFSQDQVLAAGDYLVVYADKAPELGALHANFKLSKKGESLFLVDESGDIVDQIGWGVQFTDVSFGRSPDGNGEFDFLLTPTPNEKNSETRTDLSDAGSTPSLDAGTTATYFLINEVQPQNTGAIVDAQNEAEPWLEIFNPTNTLQSLAGCFLSDTITEREKWRFSSVPDVPALGHIVVFLDQEPLEGPLHADLSFLAPGGTLYLSNPTGILIDELTYPALGSNESFGRFPDGNAATFALSPTPNQNNKRFLNDAGTEPNDAGTEPNDAGTEPNDAGTEPNDAGTEPNDAGTEPNDAG